MAGEIAMNNVENMKYGLEFPEIRFSGTAVLRCNYKNEKENSYFLVLNGEFNVDYVSNLPRSEINDFAIPISKEQYLNLIDGLQTSRAESPVIRVSGDLEVKLSSNSYV